MMPKNLSRLLLLSGTIALATGCASTTKTELATYDKHVDYQMPAVSIYHTKLSSELKSKCQRFADESVLNHCRINKVSTRQYSKQFKDTNLFEDVHFANDNIEYSIAIATASMDSETAGEISRAALSGASLMLIPMTNSMDVDAEVSVYWRNFKIKQYDYKLPYISSISLFSDKEDADIEFAQSLVSNVLKDLQTDQTLSTRFLTKTLKASNYEQDLVVPAKIANFDNMGQYIYNDPLLGSSITYAAEGFHNDRIDLYVYPIRKVDFSDEQSLLAEESKNIKNEFNSVAKQLEWTDIKFSQPKTLTVQHENQQINGVYFEGEYLQKLGEQSFTSVYLFKLKDKFVKFRASFPERFITQPISEVFAQIRVPDESVFMKELRAQGKKQQKNKDN
ncbi:MAG: hypothetical protein ACPGR2_14305 [Psychrobium sp.]